MRSHRRLIRKSVIVNTRDEQTFRGILLSQRGPLLTLANGELLEPGMAPVEISGHVVIERERVSFIQVLP